MKAKEILVKKLNLNLFDKLVQISRIGPDLSGTIKLDCRNRFGLGQNYLN